MVALFMPRVLGAVALIVAAILLGSQPGTAVADASETYRAALIVQAPEEQSKVKNYLGTVTWRLDNDPVSGKDVHADIDISEDELQASVTFQKNSDGTVPASYVIKVAFNVRSSTSTGAVKQISIPKLRMSDSANGDALDGRAVVANENSFLIELAKGSSEGTNLDLLKTRQWVDIPLELVSGRIAKLIFEKGDAGQRAMEEAISSWSTNSVVSSSPAKSDSALEPIETPAVVCAPLESSLNSLTDSQRHDLEMIKSLPLKFGDEVAQSQAEPVVPGKAVLQWSLRTVDSTQRAIFRVCMYGDDALLPPEAAGMMTGTRVNLPIDRSQNTVTIENIRGANNRDTFCTATVEPQHLRDFAICSTSIGDLVGVGVVTSVHEGAVTPTSKVNEKIIQKASDIASHIEMLTHDKLSVLNNR